MIRRPPRSTLDRSSAASDVYKRQLVGEHDDAMVLVGFVLGAGVGLVGDHLGKGVDVGACLLYTSPSPRRPY